MISQYLLQITKFTTKYKSSTRKGLQKHLALKEHLYLTNYNATLFQNHLFLGKILLTLFFVTYSFPIIAIITTSIREGFTQMFVLKISDNN